MSDGTNSKVVKYHFDELNKRKLSLLSDAEKYKTSISQVIRHLKEINITLIENNYFPDKTIRDLANITYKDLVDFGIDYDKSNFYKHFNEEQKRNYQRDEIFKETHTHNPKLIEESKKNGTVETCSCGVYIINGEEYSKKKKKSDDEKETSEQKKIQRDEIHTQNRTDNEKVLDLYNKVIKISTKIRDKLRTRTEMIKHFTDQEKREFDESAHILAQVLLLADDAFDERQKIPMHTQHVLFHIAAITTLNHTAGMYIKRVKRFGEILAGDSLKIADITSKQVTKTIKGRVSKMLPLYDPKNRDEAIGNGFYGKQCTSHKCKSWRVERDIGKNKLRCFACDNRFPIKTELLPKI